MAIDELQLEEVGCVSESGDKAVVDRVKSDDERDVRESSSQPGRRLIGGR